MGLFNSEVGISKGIVPQELIAFSPGDVAYDDNNWSMVYNGILETSSGVPLGSALGDTYLEIAYLDINFCASLNKQYHNDDTVLTGVTPSGITGSRAGHLLRRNNNEVSRSGALGKKPLTGSVTYPRCFSSTANGKLVGTFIYPLVIR